ncbi:hypothetical protein AnigIFM63326_003428 [Aspergillus niger]|nr:hypothetical protein AnigIFM63326_003428 [Aspergillus niger]
MFVLSRSPALVLSFFPPPLPLINSLLGCSSIPRLLGIVQAVSVASPFTSPLPSPMASFMQSLPVCSATRKQSTAVPFYLQKASQSRVSSGTRSSFSSLCSSARLTPSQLASRHSSQIISQPQVAAQQCRTFLVQLKRQSQTLKETPVSQPPPNLQLTNLPYFIRRTASNQLPVYLVTKAGGTKQQTKLQKTEGDLDALRNDLAQYLGLESGDPRAPKSPDVTINRLNGHIIVKGWRKSEILKFLQERNF